jgi:hypothetical protein
MDQFWETVYRQAGKLIYHPELIFEHFHPSKFKERVDYTYQVLEGLTPLEPSFSGAMPEINRCSQILREMSK